MAMLSVISSSSVCGAGRVSGGTAAKRAGEAGWGERGAARLVEHRGDEVGEARLEKRAHGEVDGPAQPRAAGVDLPAAELPAGVAQRPLADRHDEPGRLGEVDEAVGAEEAELRVAPA